MLIDSDADAIVATSLLETSNLIVLKVSYFPSRSRFIFIKFK